MVSRFFVRHVRISWMLIVFVIPSATAAEQTSDAMPPATASASARPAWVDQPDGRYGEAHVKTIVIGPEHDLVSCLTKMPSEIRAAVVEYLSNQFDRAPVELFSLDDESLIEQIADNKWEERIRLGDNEVVMLHVRLFFSPELRDEWRRKADAWRAKEHRNTFAKAWLWIAASVAVVHVALRVDRRLRIW